MALASSSMDFCFCVRPARCVRLHTIRSLLSSEFDLVPDRTCACVPSRGVTGKISGKAGGGSQFAAVRNSQAQRFAQIRSCHLHTGSLMKMRHSQHPKTHTGVFFCDYCEVQKYSMLL